METPHNRVSTSSYLLTAAGILVILGFHLLGALFAGVLVFMLIHLAQPLPWPTPAERSGVMDTNEPSSTSISAR